MKDNYITLFAPAKINLFLDICGIRSDGYHLIESIFQTVSLYDMVDISINNTKIVSVHTNNKNIPENNDNIAYKAAELFLNYINSNHGADIIIKKNIPSQAGLGGGSSDAAAVLKGLNSLLCSKLSYTELCSLAVKLGADVPFFINGGTAYVTGIGEQILQINPVLDLLHIVIAKGSNGISTVEAYSKYNKLENISHSDINSFIKSLKSCNLSSCFNVFETVTQLSDVFNIKSMMLENHALCSIMSGSGSAVFGVFYNKNTALNCAEKLKKIYPFSVYCTTC